MLDKLIDYWWYYVYNLKRHERKLLKYQGYGDRSILDFKRKNDLDWKIVKIILDNLLIMDGLELRQHLRNFVASHSELFINDNTFITHFGPAGKSGSIILNQFRHCLPEASNRIIGNDKINQLPENANIIFLDDFIGTGTQALDYIYPLTYTMNDSIKPYLFTLCSTYSGLFKIQEARSKFSVFSSYVLNEKDYFLLDKSCNKFNKNQKEVIDKLNNSIMDRGDEFFNLNIPFAFYYSIPDNAMPMLWKDDIEYETENGQLKKWYGLTPRHY
mgnify:CR=1 FL=1